MPDTRHLQWQARDPASTGWSGHVEGQYRSTAMVAPATGRLPWCAFYYARPQAPTKAWRQSRTAFFATVEEAQTWCEGLYRDYLIDLVESALANDADDAPGRGGGPR